MPDHAYYSKLAEGLTIELTTPSGDHVTLKVVGKGRDAARVLSLRIVGERSGLEIASRMAGRAREVGLRAAPGAAAAKISKEIQS